MNNIFFVPKTRVEIEQWFFHIEQVFRGMASKSKEGTVQKEDRLFIADGIKTIRMRDLPRTITITEAVELDSKLKELEIPREWIFETLRIDKYGKMWESQFEDIMTRNEVWKNLYKKSLE